MDGVPKLESAAGEAGAVLRASGTWTARHAGDLERLVSAAIASAQQTPATAIDVSAVTRLDTFGAWLVERLRRGTAREGAVPPLTGVPPDFRGITAALEEVKIDSTAAPTPTTLTRMVDGIGRGMVAVLETFTQLANMTGAIVLAGLSVFRHPARMRFTPLVYHMEQVGWRAVPIVVLITFLIGCIIAQQGIFHFRKFGADIYVVDMVSILVLREIGVLIVSIMVAGRSGSAYTAELGSMKMREEIDALRTMGFDPVEILVLPRVMALLLSLPVLTFIGSITALYGGGLVAWLYGGIEPDVFLQRLREAISWQTFAVGLIKAPFMALVIGVVACVEGFAVKGSAESLGQHTTSSVVKAIFFVIVFDGLFAIFFASIGM